MIPFFFPFWFPLPKITTKLTIEFSDVNNKGKVHLVDGDSIEFNHPRIKNAVIHILVKPENLIKISFKEKNI